MCGAQSKEQKLGEGVRLGSSWVLTFNCRRHSATSSTDRRCCRWQPRRSGRGNRPSETRFAGNTARRKSASGACVRRCCRARHPIEYFFCSGLRRILLYRSEEHTSEIQSLMRISYAVFCLKKNTRQQALYITNHTNTK